MNVIWIYHYTLNLQKQFSQFAHFLMWCVLALTPRYNIISIANNNYICCDFIDWPMQF